MNPSPKPTLLLRATGRANVSLQLAQSRVVASPTLRRAVALTPVLVQVGKPVDVCALLGGVSVEEAGRILDRSPELRACEARGVIARSVFPPPIVETPPAPVAPVKEPEPAPAPAPVLTAEPAAAAEVEVVPTPEELIAPAVQAFRGEPSMEWPEADLRAYAELRGIDVSRAKSKTAVLRRIRGAA